MLFTHHMPVEPTNPSPAPPVPPVPPALPVSAPGIRVCVICQSHLKDPSVKRCPGCGSRLFREVGADGQPTGKVIALAAPPPPPRKKEEAIDREIVSAIAPPTIIILVFLIGTAGVVAMSLWSSLSTEWIVVIGVVAFVLACKICVHVLRSGSGRHTANQCRHCGYPTTGAIHNRCPECGRLIKDPGWRRQRCPNCLRNLRGFSGDTCPECNADVRAFCDAIRNGVEPER